MTVYSDAPTIEIALDKERVKQMSSEEKLNILIDLGFANHRTIAKVAAILQGNEKSPGLCDTVRSLRKSVVVLWSIFCGVSGAFFTVLMAHILK